MDAIIDERIVDKKAQKCIKHYALAAAALCIIPIPLADSAMLCPMQVHMMWKLCKIFNIDLNKDGLKSLATAALGTITASIVGKSAASALFKLIPVVGQVGGFLISGSSAMIITKLLGNVFIELCKAFKDGSIEATNLDAAKEYVKMKFEEYMQNDLIRRNKSI